MRNKNQCVTTYFEFRVDYRTADEDNLTFFIKIIDLKLVLNHKRAVPECFKNKEEYYIYIRN